MNIEHDAFHIVLRKRTMFPDGKEPILLEHCKKRVVGRVLACACILPFFLTYAGCLWAQSSIDELPASGEAQSEPASDLPSLPDVADPTPDMNEASSNSTQEPSRSFLEIGLHASEGADTNPAGIFGGSSQLSSVTNVAGSFDLLKIRPRSQTAVNYLGGGTFWDGRAGTGHYNQQQLVARERIRWARGQLNLSDTFRYWGEGDWVRPMVSESEASGSVSVDLGDQPSQFNRQAYTTQVSTADLGEMLTRRSSANVAVSYSLTNYLANGQSSFDSRQASIIGALNHQLSRKDSVGIAYRFQNLEFPNSNVGHLFASSAMFIFHRTVSTRMELVVGAGPELVTTGGGSGPGTLQINANAQALLLYAWKRSGMSLAYNRLVTSGADVYAGANSNIFSASAYRDIFRSWRLTVDGGYTRATAINLVSATIPGNVYSYAFASTTIKRRFGSALNGFASYQFYNDNFGNCSGVPSCSVQTRRHVVSIGVDWHLRRIPLD